MSEPMSKADRKVKRDFLILHFTIEELGVKNMKLYNWENVAKRLEDHDNETGYHDKPTAAATKKRYTALLPSLKKMEPTCDVDEPVEADASETKPRTMTTRTPSSSLANKSKDLKKVSRHVSSDSDSDAPAAKPTTKATKDSSSSTAKKSSQMATSTNATNLSDSDAPAVKSTLGKTRPSTTKKSAPKTAATDSSDSESPTTAPTTSKAHEPATMSKPPSDSSNSLMVKSLSSDLKPTPSKLSRVKSPSAEDVKDAKRRMKAGKETRSVTSILGKADGVK